MKKKIFFGTQAYIDDVERRLQHLERTTQEHADLIAKLEEMGFLNTYIRELEAKNTQLQATVLNLRQMIEHRDAFIAERGLVVELCQYLQQPTVTKEQTRDNDNNTPRDPPQNL